MVHAGTLNLSKAIQKELHGLVEEDAEVADLRTRFLWWWKPLP
jgi:hypothetical protein